MALFVAVKLHSFQDIEEVSPEYLEQEVGDRRVHLKDKWGSRPVGFLPVYDSAMEADRVTRETEHLVRRLANVDHWKGDLL
jgi:hypothetical protein